MEKIAIIPARSGSKGLKDKNIIDICGKPNIAYSIEAAINSGEFLKTIVTTDSEKYKEIALKYGAEVIMRSNELSSDNASTFLVIKDILEKEGQYFDYFVLLQPTSPLRTAAHIKEAVNLFEEKSNTFDFLVSVKEAEHSKVLINTIESDYSMKNFDTDFVNYKRQDFKEYIPNGAIFIGKPKAYMKRQHFYGEKSLAYVMKKADSVDIDDEYDYEVARMLIEKRDR